MRFLCLIAAFSGTTELSDRDVACRVVHCPPGIAERAAAFACALGRGFRRRDMMKAGIAE